MFKKNSCSKCGKKVGNKFDFCPYCGNIVENREEDWGMLGKNDIPESERMNPFEKIAESMLNKMLGGAVKMFEKEMQKGMNQQKSNNPKTNIRLMINGKEIKLTPAEKKQQKKVKEVESKFFSDTKTKQFLKLPKEEPKTDLRRLSKKLVYEIELNGVSSADDVSVIKLENSIEIKAIAKEKAYFKIIPINLPLVDYDFSDEKLTLELKA